MSDDLPDYLRKVGARIRALREASGITQMQMVQESGVSQPRISAIERGAQDPQLRHLTAFARVLGVPVPELLPHESRHPLHDALEAAIASRDLGAALDALADLSKTWPARK